jgi:sRNA-binding protein
MDNIDPEEKVYSAKEIASILLEKYPVFQMKVPVKTKIHENILALHPEFKPRNLRMALSYVLGGRTYLKQIVEGAQRFDLYGNSIEECFVTKEQAESAATILLEKFNIVNGKTIPDWRKIQEKRDLEMQALEAKKEQQLKTIQKKSGIQKKETHVQKIILDVEPLKTQPAPTKKTLHLPKKQIHESNSTHCDATAG